MSELINTQQTRDAFHRHLLSTVSSLTLLAAICIPLDAKADDADRPTVWIELGADLDRMDGGQQAFAPGFVVNNPNSTAFDPVSPAQAQKPAGFSFSGEGKISFQPEDSNWVFSAGVRYGRASSTRDTHQTARNKSYYEHLTYHGAYGKYLDLIPPRHYAPKTANFLGAQVKNNETHGVIDFQAGKDVGLGLFGRKGTSVLSAGVRFAQFTSGMQSNLQARPDLAIVVWHLPNAYHPYDHGTDIGLHYHNYQAAAQSARSFRGIGPSLSWNASAPFAGNPEEGELSVDWGANAAVLFGRQKARVQHHTSAQYFASQYGYGKYHPGAAGAYNHPQVNLQRARTVTVPNVGGFAGLTFSFPNVKVSAGYRGDFFFGAMDSGFDTAKRSTIGFYGPFASVSVGIGG